MDRKFSSISIKSSKILIDAREFVVGKLTGIGRVIECLVDVLAESNSVENIILAVFEQNAVPSKLKNRQKIRTKNVSASFLKSEKILNIIEYGVTKMLTGATHY